MKLLQRIMDKSLRERVEHKLGEEQLGFIHGWDVLTKAASREETGVGGARIHGFGLCGSRKIL